MSPLPLLRGRVLDMRRHPVSGARIVLERAPHPVPDIALLSDARGRFELFLPGEGRYVVAVHAHGLESGRLLIDTARWRGAPPGEEVLLLADRR